MNDNNASQQVAAPQQDPSQMPEEEAAGVIDEAHTKNSHAALFLEESVAVAPHASFRSDNDNKLEASPTANRSLESEQDFASSKNAHTKENNSLEENPSSITVQAFHEAGNDSKRNHDDAQDEHGDVEILEDSPHGMQPSDASVALSSPDGGEGAKENQLWPGQHTNTELQAIAGSMSEPEKSSHCDLLLGLFLQCSTSELESLAKKTGLRFVATRSKKRMHQGPCGHDTFAYQQGTSKKQRSSMNLTSASSGNRREEKGTFCANAPPPPRTISLLPLALSTFLEKEDGENARKSPPIHQEDQGISLKRKNYESLTMRELERKVLSKFEATPAGQLAISTENPLYTKFLSSSDKVPAAALSIVQQARRKFTPMTLQYNECSLSAFASWAFTRRPTGSQFPPEKSANGRRQLAGVQVEVPSSSVLFHICQVCEKWGHYEVECDFAVGQAKMSDVSNEVRSLKKLLDLGAFPLTGSPPNDVASKTCDICKYAMSEALSPYQICKDCGSVCHCACLSPSWDGTPQQDWLCKLCTERDSRDKNGTDGSIDIEGCDGFVLEQRIIPTESEDVEVEFLSKSMGLSFGDSSWSTAVCIADAENLSSFVASQSEVDPSSSVPDVVIDTDKERHFAVGELCWAKRSHSGKGNYARDEWWPAQVINQITDPRSFQQFRTHDMTPNLVKFFAIPRASRVRASHILPFFDHFRTIGFGRISASKPPFSDSDVRFRRGVEEVIGMMGYKSLKQLLDHSDEMASSAISQKETRKRKRNDKKSDVFTTWFKQDRFFIRAKESDGKANPNSKTKLADRMNGLTCQEPVKTYSRTKIIGCVVAWMSTEQSKTVMHVGTVIAANTMSKLALVSPIPGWEDKLKAPSAKNKVCVQHHGAAPAQWIPMTKLHMIANGPDEGCKQEITNQVISDLLLEARSQLEADAAENGSVARAEMITTLQEGASTPREIEGILKERNSYAGREYLVKWLGLPMTYATWKAESTIGNRKHVLLYKVNRLINALSLSAPMKEPGSATLRVVTALKVGMKELETASRFPSTIAPDSPFRTCPFCDDALEDAKLADHMKVHEHEQNYTMIREAARLAQMRWYDK